MDKQRRRGMGGRTADAFRSRWRGGGCGLLTSGQPCKSRKPRRWPWSKVCLVKRGDFWQTIKGSNETTRLHFFHSLCFTESSPLKWRAASWQGSLGNSEFCLQCTALSYSIVFKKESTKWPKHCWWSAKWLEFDVNIMCYNMIMIIIIVWTSHYDYERKMSDYDQRF